MADFEQFLGLDTGEGQMTPEAVEAFKEQMRKNAQAIKAIQREERKQKKHEDKLAIILKMFMKRDDKRQLVMLITRVLEINVPAFFIVSIILLGNEDLQHQSGINLELNPPNQEQSQDENESKTPQSPFEKNYLAGDSHEESNLITFQQEQLLPLKIKLSIDLWIKNIYQAGMMNPYKVRNTALDVEYKLKPQVIDLTRYILQEYLASQNLPNNTQQLNQFCQVMLEGIMKQLEKSIEKNRLAEAPFDDPK